MADRLDRNRAAIAAALAIAVLVLVAVAQFVPWLTTKRDVVSSTPVRADMSVVQPIALRPDQRACLNEVTFDASTQVAQLTIGPAAATGTRLQVEAAAPGYRATAAARVLPQQFGRLDVPFSPPRRGTVGTLCVQNAGRRAIELAGTGDSRALTRSRMTIDGVEQAPAFSLALREATQRSYLERVPQLVDHAAALNAFGPWFLWLLLVLLLVGVPAGVIAALHSALREPDPDAPRRPVRE